MDANLISTRRREVENDLLRLRRQVEDLQRELGELETADRVLKRLSSASGTAASASDKQSEAEASRGKPKDLPSIPEMIVQVLREDVSGSMTPKEIAVGIAKRWWPEVKGERINAIAWRMWKHGRLDKDDEANYSLPKTETASGG